jgi:hypothetical protein
MIKNAFHELVDLKDYFFRIEAASIRVEQPEEEVWTGYDKNMEGVYNLVEGVELDLSLKLGHSTEEFNAFCKALDFQYNAGVGGQNLFGTVWFTDGTWATREEYNGSEWWEHHVRPEIPVELC